MSRGEDWTRIEVEACVADYLRMLTLQLQRESYSKSEHARRLMKLLDDRSRPSIEFKHSNISAVMVALGYPYIEGYKPRGNYQALLRDVVEAQTSTNGLLQEAAQTAVSRPADPVVVDDLDAIWVSRPKPSQVREQPASYTPRFAAAKRDYLSLEARNRSLGHAGELLVLELEARRLHAAGKKSLSNRIEHVAATQGDGLGFDVLSFEENGRERLIEVKTTAFGKFTPFFVSRTELKRSEIDAERYRLYRLFDFRTQPRLFELQGAITTLCNLVPESYRASIAI